MPNQDSQIFKFYRNCNKLTSHRKLLVSSMGTDMIFITFSDTSFYIFGVEKFKLLFIGPQFEKIDAACFDGGALYVCCGNTVYECERGIVKKSWVFPESKGNLLTIDTQESEVEGVNLSEMNVVGFKQIVKFGNVVCLLTYSNVLIVTEDFDEVFRIKNVSYMFHPFTYINKLFISTCDGQHIMYNISKRKIVYTYKNIGEGLLFIEPSKSLDIVSLGYKSGEVSIFNLKKDKKLFSFEVDGVPTSASFTTDKIYVSYNNRVSVFDLDKKMKITDSNGVLDTRVLDDKYVLTSSRENIAIFELSGSSLHLIKRKEYINENVVDIGFVDSRSLVAVGIDRVVLLDIFFENKNFRFSFTGSVEKFSIDDDVTVYGNRELHVLSPSMRKSIRKLATAASAVCSYGDFLSFYNDKLYVVNKKSGIVHSSYDVKIDSEVVSLKMDIDNIWLSTKTGLHVFNRVNGSIKFINEDIVGFEYFKQGFSIFGKRTIKFYNRKLKVFRQIGLSSEDRHGAVDEEIKAISVSRDIRWIAILLDSRILVYDILTSTKIDEIVLESEASKIVFSPSTDFLCVLYTDGSINMYANKLFFAPSKTNFEKHDFTEFRTNNDNSFIKFVKTKQKLCDELVLFKKTSQTTDDGKIESNNEDVENSKVSQPADSLLEIEQKTLKTLLSDDWIKSLSKDEVRKIINLLGSHLKTSYGIVQNVIHKILRHHSMILEPEDVREYFDKFYEIYSLYEEDFILSLGYLSLEKDGVI